jgi:integrase
VQGACRRHELCDLTVNDIEDKGDMLLVKIPKTKNDKPRSFVVTDNFYHIYKKYAILRPNNVSTTRFFLNYRDGRCSQQVIGINTFGSMPKTVALFLKLKDPESYTGHTFRRTSATLLADSGADLLTLKRHGGWKSNTVAEGYVEDSVCQKKRIGQQIANAISEKPSTSRERPHHQINPNDQITTQSPIYKKKKTLKLKILTHVIIHKVLIFISPIARIFL